MRTTSTLSASAAVAIFFTVVGCGRSSRAPDSISMAEAPGKVHQAFDGASAELKKAADEASEALANGDYDVSLGRISELSSRPDLSSEQRTALAQSQVALMRKLQEEAAAGNAKAAQLMELHRASK